MGSRRSRVGRGLLAGVVAVAGMLATATGARADEVYPATSDGILHLHGHGWGHGHGMSQYGSLGAANAGLKWPAILSFYYQNTSRTSIGNPTLRINVPRVSSSGIIQVRNTTTLRLSWTGNTGTWASVGSDTRYPASAWRIRATGNGTSVVEYYRTGTNAWTLYGNPPSGYAVFDDPTAGTVTAMLSSGDQVVYRGQLRGVMSGTTLVPVVAMPMEDYLKSVVPSESPSSWPLDALGAQAVAARSYAEYYRQHPRAAQYDICDSTACQVFSGTSINGSPREYASSNQAIAATAGTVLTYQGAVVFAEFSSSNGGWTSYGGKPYLLARQDPYDATPSNPNHSWDASIPVTTIQGRWPQIGTYRDLRITQRDGNGEWGGRVLQAVVEGSAGSVTVSGTAFQSAFGLKSEWFIPFNPPSYPSWPRDFTGDGNADVMGVDSQSGRLRLYPGNGTGGWQDPVVMGPGWGGFAKVFTAGTWDGDNVSDVMAQGTDGTLYLYPGTGAGGLGAPRVVGNGWQVMDTVFATGDFNGDGWSDLLARRASDGALLLYAGDGQGGFLSSRQVGSGWGGFTAVFSPGDFDGDGNPDVLARAADGSLWLYPGDGRGGWRSPRVVGTGWNGFTALTSPGDFDGDGRADVLARAADGTLRLYPGNGAGGWRAPVTVGTGWGIFSTILP
ncbi:SpoIID/LytB domain-containing protein [Pedococcus sp. NPDC057267]|uniref:SpoIID/LytB domain-containing protein n=1 Tax=Pedococcus sp. NPDC057267 TaxID=3346077 RepID=UPI0036366828